MHETVARVTKEDIVDQDRCLTQPEVFLTHKVTAILETLHILWNVQGVTDLRLVQVTAHTVLELGRGAKLGMSEVTLVTGFTS